MQNQNTRLLVIRSGAIGDTIVMSVVFQALRKHFPQAYIEAIGGTERLHLINCPGLIDNVTSIEFSEIESLFSEDEPLPVSIANYFEQFDHILLYSFRLAKDLPNLIRVVPFPPDDARIHITRYLLDSLSVLGIQAPGDLQPKIFLSTTSQPQASLSIPKIAIHPGSGSRKKNWATENFIELGRCLRRDYECEFIMIAGPAEDDSVQKIKQQLSEFPLRILRNRPLSEIAAELQHCTLYIGNDSGISHLAAAIGIPTITIFGPSNPHVWRPTGRQVRVLYDNTKKTCDAISVAKVLAETRNFLYV